MILKVNVQLVVLLKFKSTAPQIISMSSSSFIYYKQLFELAFQIKNQAVTLY